MNRIKTRNLNYYDCLIYDKLLTNSDVLLQAVSNFIVHPELQPWLSENLSFIF